MLARLNSASLFGIEGVMIKVEVDLARGLPAFDIVGLPDTAVRESRERVKSAIRNSGFEFPVKRITINLAPGDIKKAGPHFDLSIAVGILAASGQINIELIENNLFVGELSLNGELRSVKGVLPMASVVKDYNLKGIILPKDNCKEANLIHNIEINGFKHLKGVVEFLNGRGDKKPSKNYKYNFENILDEGTYDVDFSEIKGQQEARRALEVAAAGGHNIILIGPPGSGKTMLARRVRTILPALSQTESLELSRIYSILGLINCEDGLKIERPFRAPHHSITSAGLIGGGQIPEPGEISLAHHGTLFLDEIPEYKRKVLELLRQPLEEGRVTIARKTMTVTYPADFMLIAAQNPCPCGYYGDDRHQCRCTIRQINNYRTKISGPLMDRIDLHIEVPPLNVDEITGEFVGEKSIDIRKRVIIAYEIQKERYRKEDFSLNSHLNGKKLNKYCDINSKSKMLLRDAINSFGLSARGYNRILRLARTIADLDNIERINSDHIAEAIQYRGLDRRLR